jgi:hypothetical protein
VAPQIWAILLLLLGSLILVVALLLLRRRSAPEMRPLAAFRDLPGQVARAAETGGAVHVALGLGGLASEDAMTSVAAWDVIDSLADDAVAYRVPIVISVGDPTLIPLAQDALRRAFEERGAPELYNPAWVRFIAPSQFAYAGGAATIAADETVTANVMAGAFGSEATLIADAAARRGLPQSAAAVNSDALGALYPATARLAIGEELFAAGAEITREPRHVAGLIAQDVLRVVVAAAIVVIALLALVGG